MTFHSDGGCRYRRRAAFRPLHAWSIRILGHPPRLKPFKRVSGVHAAYAFERFETWGMPKNSDRPGVKRPEGRAPPVSAAAIRMESHSKIGRASCRERASI